MNIIKRIKNLWKLSEIEVPNLKLDELQQKLIRQNKPPEIIKRTTPVEDFLQKQND